MTLSFPGSELKDSRGLVCSTILRITEHRLPPMLFGRQTVGLVAVTGPYVLRNNAGDCEAGVLLATRGDSWMITNAKKAKTIGSRRKIAKQSRTGKTNNT